jgi:hypothetical protein
LSSFRPRTAPAASSGCLLADADKEVNFVATMTGLAARLVLPHSGSAAGSSNPRISFDPPVKTVARIMSVHTLLDASGRPRLLRRREYFDPDREPFAGDRDAYAPLA